MSIKSFELPIIELSHEVVFSKAKLINNSHTLSVADLTESDRLRFISEILKINTNIDNFIQEFINDACMDRSYAESQGFGGWDE